MTILCVDDEQLVLDHTLSLCRELPQKLDAVGFLSAEEALVWLENTTSRTLLCWISICQKWTGFCSRRS